MLELEQLQTALPGYRFVKAITENNSDTETVTITLEYTKNHIGLMAQLKRNGSVPLREVHGIEG